MLLSSRGSFSFLCKGYSVLCACDRTLQVASAEDELVVNIGDLFQRLTNDAWESTLHRVRLPMPEENHSRVLRRGFESGAHGDQASIP